MDESPQGATPGAEPSDAEIAAQIRPILELTAERERLAVIVERLRTASDPEERAERDRAGNAMADLDREICERSIIALDRIGLWHAAGMASAALDQTIASGEMDPPPREPAA
ncbi:hypothetical protein [Leucobacter iarius]|uniref:Uncharacterized protein n=1 Tax=Leucobacter iarius TaxID=333963 RepID=A0ABN2L804_9MICO